MLNWVRTLLQHDSCVIDRTFLDCSGSMSWVPRRSGFSWWRSPKGMKTGLLRIKGDSVVAMADLNGDGAGSLVVGAKAALHSRGSS